MKGSITINKVTYKLPMSYKDITLKDFKALQLFIDNQKEITDYILENKGEPNELDLLNYYVTVVSLATKIPKDTLLLIPRYTNEDSIGIEGLFRSLTWLYVYPDIDEAPPKKILGYRFIDDSGIMKNNTLLEYTEANTLVNALNNVDKDYNMINLIMALFYRKKSLFGKIEPYKSEIAKERAKEFDNIDMHTIYSCLFFFLKSRNKYLKNTEAYFKEEVVKVLTPSKVINGSYLSMILQKVEYLRLVIYLRMNQLIKRIYMKYLRMLM